MCVFVTHHQEIAEGIEFATAETHHHARLNPGDPQDQGKGGGVMGAETRALLKQKIRHLVALHGPRRK